MPSQYDDSLFDDTRMTFGEHLEELRRALFKSVVVVGIGFLVGLYFGDAIVNWLQDPLVAALEQYQSNRAVRELRESYQKRGEPVPPDDQLRKQLGSDALVSEEVLIDPARLLAELKRQYPEQFAALPNFPPATADIAPSADELLRLKIWRPSSQLPGVRAQALSPQEAFMIYLKASLVAGLLFASPLVFYFVWQFVAAGLYPHERRHVHLILPMSIGLFLSGAALVFFFVFEYVLGFLFRFNAALGIDPSPRISEWLTFALVLPIGFGLSFQLPLVMLFLERVGIVTRATFTRKWRMAVLVIAVISMVLTPADPISMLLMFGPLTVLYFGGILLCKYLPRSKAMNDEL